MVKRTGYSWFVVMTVAADAGREVAILTAHFSYRMAAVYQDEHTADAALDTVIAAMAGNIRAIELAPGSSDIDGAFIPQAATGTHSNGDAGCSAPVMTSELYVSAPVVAPLIVLGYGGVLGNTAGTICGLRLHERVFTDLLKDALRADFHVLIIHAANMVARRHAATVLEGTLPGYCA